MADKQKMSVTGLFKSSLGGFCVQCKDDIAIGDLVGFLRGYLACKPCKNDERPTQEIDTRGFL